MNFSLKVQMNRRHFLDSESTSDHLIEINPGMASLCVCRLLSEFALNISNRPERVPSGIDLSCILHLESN